jgi:hypothetical protein
MRCRQTATDASRRCGDRASATVVVGAAGAEMGQAADWNAVWFDLWEVLQSRCPRFCRRDFSPEALDLVGGASAPMLLGFCRRDFSPDAFSSCRSTGRRDALAFTTTLIFHSQGATDYETPPRLWEGLQPRWFCFSLFRVTRPGHPQFRISRRTAGLFSDKIHCYGHSRPPHFPVESVVPVLLPSAVVGVLVLTLNGVADADSKPHADLELLTGIRWTIALIASNVNEMLFSDHGICGLSHSTTDVGMKYQ